MSTVESIEDVYALIKWDEIKQVRRLIDLINNKRFEYMHVDVKGDQYLKFTGVIGGVNVYDEREYGIMEDILRKRSDVSDVGFALLDIDMKCLPASIAQLINKMPFEKFPTFEGGSVGVRLKKFMKYHPDIARDPLQMTRVIEFLKKYTYELYYDKFRAHWWRLHEHGILVCTNLDAGAKSLHHISFDASKAVYPVGGKKPNYMFAVSYDVFVYYIFDNGLVIKYNSGIHSIYVPMSVLAGDGISINQQRGTISIEDGFLVITSNEKIATKTDEMS